VDRELTLMKIETLTAGEIDYDYMDFFIVDHLDNVMSAYNWQTKINRQWNYD